MDYKTVLIVADLHIGSAFGLMPDDFTGSNATTIPLNSGQKYLLNCWRDIERQSPKKIDVLVTNGDLVEGQAKIDEGRGVTEVDPLFQELAAEHLLKPLADKANRVYCATGSKYHTGRGNRSEENVAERIGAIPRGARYCRPMVIFEVNGVRISCHHKQPMSTKYRSTALESEIGYALEYAGRTGERPPDVHVMSHLHWGFGLWRESRFLSMSTPSMKLQDTFTESSARPWRFRPYEIGVILLKVLDSKYVQVEPMLYSHPKIEV